MHTGRAESRPTANTWKRPKYSFLSGLDKHWKCWCYRNLKHLLKNSNNIHAHHNPNYFSLLAGNFFWRKKIYFKNTSTVTFTPLFHLYFNYCFLFLYLWTKQEHSLWCMLHGHKQKVLPWWAFVQSRKLAMYVLSTNALMPNIETAMKGTYFTKQPQENVPS